MTIKQLDRKMAFSKGFFLLLTLILFLGVTYCNSFVEARDLFPLGNLRSTPIRQLKHKISDSDNQVVVDDTTVYDSSATTNDVEEGVSKEVTKDAEDEEVETGEDEGDNGGNEAVEAGEENEENIEKGIEKAETKDTTGAKQEGVSEETTTDTKKKKKKTDTVEEEEKAVADKEDKGVNEVVEAEEEDTEKGTEKAEMEDTASTKTVSAATEEDASMTEGICPLCWAAVCAIALIVSWIGWGMCRTRGYERIPPTTLNV